MKPLDPRLMKYAKASRSYILLIAAAGVVTSLLVITQTILIAAAITPVITRKIDWNADTPYFYLGALAGVALTRALVIIIISSRAHRAAAATIAQLRHRTLTHAAKLGPRWLAKNGIDTVTLTTRSLDDLAPYFVNYLPQLLLCCTVTPLVMAVIAYFDIWSALVALLTIFLVPLFMILIGKFTRDFSNRKLATMQKLSAQMLDLITGLATLKALGRERGPETRIANIGNRYAKHTMATLRVAFLSGAVLEFIATLSVAMVAVNIGIRLVFGDVDLFTGLIVITLAPEVYLPLREVGKQFHASTDGVTAANRVFEILETQPATNGSTPCPDLRYATITLADVSIAARGRWAPNCLSGDIHPGRIVALDGTSGVGKTTTIMALLGFQELQRGSIYIDGVNITQLDHDSLWCQITWVPQSPAIIAGTIAENIGLQDVSAKDFERIAKKTGFSEVIKQMPKGLETYLGHGGVGLSIGQRQRLALTRALLQNTPLVILDEPTAHLDAKLEENVLSAIGEIKAQGRTVIMIAHRQAVKNLADDTLLVNSSEMTPTEIAQWNINDPKDNFSPVEMPGMLAMLDQEVNR